MLRGFCILRTVNLLCNPNPPYLRRCREKERKKRLPMAARTKQAKRRLSTHKKKGGKNFKGERGWDGGTLGCPFLRLLRSAAVRGSRWAGCLQRYSITLRKHLLHCPQATSRSGDAASTCAAQWATVWHGRAGRLQCGRHSDGV